MSTPKNLVLLLLEAGMSAADARHVTRELDRLRLCNLGSEDIASLLYGWRTEAVRYERWLGGELYRKYGFENGEKTLFDPLMRGPAAPAGG